MANYLLWGRPQRPPLSLTRPLAALGLLLATAGVAQAQTLTIQGMGSASASSSDVTAFVDKVEIVRVLDGAVMTGALANAGFETPSLGAGNFAYRPTGATWTFTGNAGISSSGGGFSPPTIPEGSQTALIQTSSSSVAQPLTLAAGTYQVRFLATQRTNCCGAPYDQKLTVSVGGTQVGTTTPPASGFTSFTSNAFTVNGSGAVTTNNALAFDGTDDYVSGTNATLPQGNAARTLEAWVRPTGTSNGVIFNYGTATSNLRSGMLVIGGKLYYAGENNDVQGNLVVNDGKWHHVAVSYDGTTLRLYVDGVLDVARTPPSGAFNTTGTNWWMGSRIGGGSEFLNCGLDEVRVYNVGLTQAQVQADMFSTNSAVPGSQKYYANFDQGTAGGNNAGITSLTDQSGNGSTGTLTNFALTGTSSNWVRSFPTITSISPTSGAAGNNVTVMGTNLTDATSFAFNGTGTTGFTTPTNDLSATVTVPSGATTGPVSVASAALTRYNGPVFTLAAQTNNALAFDGIDDYVALPSSTPVPVGNSAYTLEAWIKPTSMGPYGILGWGNYGTNNQANAFRLDAAGGGQLINYWWNNDLPVQVGDLSGQWHHVAATFDGTTRRIYLDGVLKGSDTPSGHNVPNANNLRIGSTNNGEYFPGSLDEVRIYNVGLTQAQVQADMFSTSSAVPGSLKYYANFDQGTAGGNNAGLTSLTDQSGNGNTGTLTNFALTGTSSNWVRSFPTITGISPTTGKSGTSVTVTGTNLTDATSFAFNGTSTTNFATPTSDLTATITAPVGVTTGPVSVASATLTKYNGPVFTLSNDLVVTTTQSIPGDSYSSITVQSGGNGTLADDVTVSGPIVVQSGGRLADGCHLFTGSGSFTLNAGGTLDICRPRGILSGPNTGLGNIGAVRVTGARSYSADASYVYSGGQSQDTGDGLPAQVRNFSVGTSTDLSLTNPLAVAQVLTLSGAGNLTTGGKTLTLLSSSVGTALIVNSGSGTVNGAATVQRYIDPSLNSGNGYRHYSAPVSNTTLADLATTGYAPEISQAATYNSSATPGTTTPFPTLFAYDQSRLATVSNNYPAFDKGFVVPTSLSTAMTVGRGYVAQIGAAALVDFVGTPTTGDQATLNLSRNAVGTPNASAAGWQLVGNPYPSPLDWSLVAAADRQNLDGAMYVVQSSGPYAGSYRTYTNGQSTSATNNPLIASSQGFWVRVSSNSTSGSLTFRNAQRVTSYASQQAFQRTTTDPRPALRLELAGAGLADGWVAYAEAGATAAFDPQYDAAKLPNSTGLNLSSTSATDNLAIDGQAAFTAATVLPLAVGVPAAGTYTLTATALSNLPAGLDATLRDAQTGQTVRLTTGQGYAFSVSSAQAQALLTGRFTVQFAAAAPLASAPALLAAAVRVFPNPAPAHASVRVGVPGVAGASAVQAVLLNALGQVVRRQSATLPGTGTELALATEGLAAGLYVLRLTAGQATATQRLVVE